MKYCNIYNYIIKLKNTNFIFDDIDIHNDYNKNNDMYILIEELCLKIKNYCNQFVEESEMNNFCININNKDIFFKNVYITNIDEIEFYPIYKKLLIHKKQYYLKMLKNNILNGILINNKLNTIIDIYTILLDK